MAQEIPEGKRLNSFTGELVDKKPVSLAPSPMDQQILGMIGDKPLIDLCEEVVNSIGDDSGPKDNSGPSLTEDSHPRLASLPTTTDTNTLPGPSPEGPVQRVDAPSANEIAVKDGSLIVGRDTETPQVAVEPTPRKHKATKAKGKK